ncbi:hypothetical protein PGR6_36750 [Pseudomonas sp. GR 6-02]|nr:hypothetical protein PGR6_36750 [Pseudomonas sp. GR 6-02]
MDRDNLLAQCAGVDTQAQAIKFSVNPLFSLLQGEFSFG